MIWLKVASESKAIAGILRFLLQNTVDKNWLQVCYSSHVIHSEDLAYFKPLF